ncbi:MAG: glycosyltransferase family 2 protein [Lachnospiraceae bacterium]|nr:glycosyltransferase family 2 protein [Lachnospiraceae bacterium]
MKFSIIIPAYNAEGHIRRALDSIAQQTYRDYELIVVCDSCTDATEEIAKGYGARTASVDFHRDGLTRNIGIDMAQGEWILFMDDDDWWLHEYVLEQLAGMAGRENEDILAFSFIWKGVKYAAPGTNGGGHYIAVWNKCWRRSFIGDTRFPDTENWSDVEFHAAMMAKRPRIVQWDMPMYYYNYMRPGSICWTDAINAEGAIKWAEKDV